jgi:hypothetical protein
MTGRGWRVEDGGWRRLGIVLVYLTDQRPLFYAKNREFVCDHFCFFIFDIHLFFD